MEREKMASEIYKMGTYFRHETRGRVRGTAHEGFLSTWSCMFLRLMQAEGFNIQTILIFYRSCVCPGILMGDVLQKVPQVQVWAAAWAWITYWYTIDLMSLETSWGKELRKSTCCLFWMIISGEWESLRKCSCCFSKQIPLLRWELFCGKIYCC